jgi:hypothetical protein
MSWTDADAPEIEQQALRLAMALKTGLGNSWEDWWPDSVIHQAVAVRGWVAVAEFCRDRAAPWTARDLYEAYLAVAGNVGPKGMEWEQLDGSLRVVWRDWVGRRAREIWEEWL